MPFEYCTLCESWLYISSEAREYNNAFGRRFVVDGMQAHILLTGKRKENAKLAGTKLFVRPVVVT